MAAKLGERKPSPARIYADILGGIDSSAADRKIARKLAVDHPVLSVLTRQNRRFLERAVRRLALLDGISRFLDLGAGPPIILRDGTHFPMVHEVAREAGVRPKVVYLDHDPVVTLHTGAAVAGQAGITVIKADLSDVPAVLADEAVRDLAGTGEPVAVILAAVLHYWNAPASRAIVSAYMTRMPSGSAAVVSLACLDQETAAERRELLPDLPFHDYDERDIRDFFSGLEYWPLLAAEGDRPRIVGGLGFKR